MNDRNWDRELNVLFLCTGNSARSIMAEAILAREGAGRFRSYSAGSTPRGYVDPTALDVLAKLNHDTSGLRSKSWEEFSGPDAPPLDFVFTLCDDAADEVCPIWPGQPMTAHWGLPDPAAFEGPEPERYAVFYDTYRMLYNRISLFTSLPFSGLDSISLQSQLHDIGRARVAAPTQGNLE